MTVDGSRDSLTFADRLSYLWEVGTHRSLPPTLATFLKRHRVNIGNPDAFSPLLEETELLQS